MRLMALFFLAAIPVLAGPGYPLKRSSNNRYLVDQNNVPFLLIGDSPQGLMGNLTPSQMASFFADRQAEGFNAVYVMLLCGDYTGGKSTGAAQDGTLPFTSGTNENNYDFSTPNSAYFTEIDAMINLAATYNLSVLLNPLDTGLNGGTSGWLVAARASGTTKMHNYGVFLGNRYKNFTNIIWHHGNDFQDWSTNGSDNNLVYQVMAGIASADPNHLQTIELNYFTSYSSQDTALSSVLTLDGVYNQEGVYDGVYQAYNSSPTLPVFLTESDYEYENVTGGLSPWPGGPPPNLPNATYDLVPRLAAWWTLTSGGVGQIYGNHYTWSFASGWQSGMDSAGASQIQYINSFFNSIPWWNLVPDQTHQIVTSGYGTYNATGLNMLTNNYATTAWVTDGSLAVIYTPAANSLVVNLAKFNQTGVKAQWYDPTNGTYTQISGSPFANSGSHTFAIPGSNQSGKSDWVLVLQAAGAANKPMAPTGLATTVN